MGPRMELNNPKLFAMMRRRSSFLEEFMEDALALIHKMKHSLNTRHMRWVKEGVRIAKRNSLKISFCFPETGGRICVGNMYTYMKPS